MMRFRRLSTYVLLLLISISAAGCNAQTEAQKKFGADAYYFMGLRLLADGNEKAARDKFNRCIRKGSYFCAKKSAETLCTFGSIQEKNEAAKKLIQRFTEEDSLLIAAKQFAISDETNILIESTANLDFSKAKNELIRLRLEAMGNRGDSNYESEVYRWFTECTISTEHYQFYRDFYNHPDFDLILDNPDAAQDLKYTPEQFAIHYRIQSYKRNYTYAMLCSPKLAEFFENGTLVPKPQLVSDFGKNYLYGSNDFTKNAMYFKQLAEKWHDTPAEFYFWFYAGRLFDKAGVYFRQTKLSFEAAIACAESAEQKDNALWYLLDTSLSFSVDFIINSIGEYSRQWSDPEYFEDFFDSLVPALLASGKWDAFGDIYRGIVGYASDLTTAQFAYVYGRLVQEGLAKGSDFDAKAAFMRACNSGTSIYYKVLAAYRLGISPDSQEFYEIITKPGKKAGSAIWGNSKKDAMNAPSASAAEQLLLGYAYFGFPELIYPEWQKYCNLNLSTDTGLYLSDFLGKCAGSDPKKNVYYPQALRIASRSQIYAERNLTCKEMKLLFPEFYSDFVRKYCTEYDIQDPIMYALIRSESFFDASITSSAGAIGLTQLMEMTAGDIARRLKMKSYSLVDPETNIRFGTYYLESLVSRCEGSYLLGFFSYNAGITRVRKWLRSSLIEFDNKSGLPLDLFLETLPYSETREYGRKLISATAMYQWLSPSAPQTTDIQAYNKMIEQLLK